MSHENIRANGCRCIAKRIINIGGEQWQPFHRNFPSIFPQFNIQFSFGLWDEWRLPSAFVIEMHSTESIPKMQWHFPFGIFPIIFHWMPRKMRAFLHFISEHTVWIEFNRIPYSSTSNGISLILKTFPWIEGNLWHDSINPSDIEPLSKKCVGKSRRIKSQLS